MAPRTNRRTPPASVDLEALRETIKKLRAVKVRAAKIKAEETALWRTIRDAMGESPQGTLDGAAVVLVSTTERTNVDIPGLRDKYPDLDIPVKIVRVQSVRLVDQP